MKNNKIFVDELKRTFPIYMIGIIFHGLTIYILYKIPEFIGNILDLLLNENINKEIIMNEVYTLLFYSVILIIPRISYRILFFTRARISDTYLRKKVIEHLQNVKLDYFEKEEKGAFLAYLSRELLSIRRFLGNGFFNFARLIVAPIIGIIVIGKDINYILGLTLIPIIPLGIYNLYKLYMEEKKVIEKSRKVYLDLSKTIEQNTSGFTLIKLYNEQENQKNKFNEINEKAKIADENIGIVKNKISNVVNILYTICYSLGFSLGLILIKNNIMTVGELTAYIACITLILSEISNSIEPLINGIAYFKQASKRFNYFFNLETYNRNGKVLEKVEKIEIKNLSYSYKAEEKAVLDDINIEIKAGEKIGIVGQVGSGKTTLMNIIAGILEAPKNTIYINGIDINEYTRESIFENIGYAMQRNVITDDTIKNNIDIREENNIEKIEEISKKASIYEDIKNMQDGFQTLIGENGERISGGQKQRIQIARNLLYKKSINIFDDTLSALDAETEKEVMKEIGKEVEDSILIIVSNKISAMEKMDKIYVIIDGKLEDSGTHKELLERNQLYNELSTYEKVGDLE